MRWIFLLISCASLLSTTSQSALAQDEDPFFSYYADMQGPTARIINGQDAPPNRYPYYVALFDKNA
jgi:hypothetical protein